MENPNKFSDYVLQYELPNNNIRIIFSEFFNDEQRKHVVDIIELYKENETEIMNNNKYREIILKIQQLSGKIKKKLDESCEFFVNEYDREQNKKICVNYTLWWFAINYRLPYLFLCKFDFLDTNYIKKFIDRIGNYIKSGKIKH